MAPALVVKGLRKRYRGDALFPLDALWMFMRQFQSARARGALLNIGE
jgi:hypothetical protein